MSRRAVAVLVAGVALLAAAGAVVAGLLTGREPQQPPSTGEAVVFRTSVSPGRHLFGDRIVAELTVVVDEQLALPETVAVAPRFEPFQQVAPTELTVEDLGRMTILTYSYALQCLGRACAPGEETKTIDLPLGVIQYGRPGLGGLSELVPWPSVTVASRLEPGDLDDPLLEVDEGELVAPTFRANPLALGWLAVGLAAALVLAVGLLVARRVWRSGPAEVVEAKPATVAGSSLLRAAELVRAAAETGDGERRLALDELARALEEAGDHDLARLARGLAWSRPDPEAAEMLELAEAAARAEGSG